MGAFADFNSTIKSRATFIGAYSDADGNDIVALGYDARTSADKAISVGSYSRASSTRSITMGYGNYVGSTDAISIGSEPSATALQNSIGTSSNKAIALGNAVKIGNSSPNSVAIGYGATITGIETVVYGYLASGTADNAIAIGTSSSVTGSNSIVIGNGASASGTNSIAIGDAANVTASNEVYIGNASTATIGGAVNWTATSDARFKKNVQGNVPGLDFINKLKPVTYNFDMEKLMAWDGGYSESLKAAAAQKRESNLYRFLSTASRECSKKCRL